MERFDGLDRTRLTRILEQIRTVRVALLGDLCLDVHWHADMTRSELSRETPHFPLPVVRETLSPGAGGNVAANLAALQPQHVHVLGVVGRDWRGDCLKRAMAEAGPDVAGIVESRTATTNAYCKPLRKGLSDVEYEDPRIDFTNHQPLSTNDEAELIDRLDSLANHLDVLCVADQLAFGCITPLVRERVLFHASQGLRIIVDSRDRIGRFTGVVLKPNEIEAVKAVGSTGVGSATTLEQNLGTARALAERNRSAVCMTLGAQGCLYVDSERAVHVPAVETSPPIDFCGAGDTFMSAFACALATDATPEEAAAFGNLAASITIQKIGITGTAAPQELLAR